MARLLIGSFSGLKNLIQYIVIVFSSNNLINIQN